MEEAETGEVDADLGLAGCAHARKGGSRQALLVDKETLDAMELHPGIIRENIATQGLNVNGLEMGQRLRTGTVLLQVSAVCTPCDQLEKVRPGCAARCMADAACYAEFWKVERFAPATQFSQRVAVASS
jgi:hypothetical protein